MQNKYTCNVCKHYLGWNDWAIPCEVKYDDVDKDLNACESFRPTGKARCMFRKVPINKNGLNANVKAHVLSDDKMRKLGFTDLGTTSWYFCKHVGKYPDITFNVSIPKKNPDGLEIDVLDEYFCQPYDYQSMLERNPHFAPALEVKESVDMFMMYLIDNGVLSGWSVGDYL
jgi:hypothetical protein